MSGLTCQQLAPKGFDSQLKPEPGSDRDPLPGFWVGADTGKETKPFHTCSTKQAGVGHYSCNMSGLATTVCCCWVGLGSEGQTHWVALEKCCSDPFGSDCGSAPERTGQAQDPSMREQGAPQILP